ncbi:hypothetical protein [Rhodohalobacter sp. 8-1]|uniref:hypothetical protein n=1 Tax=Rhodohalobacter sp. 8-1 TaxID=3131972 RepID=UPI0030EEC792
MSRSPSHLTGGIVWKNIKGHQRIAIISDDGTGVEWKLPVVVQDPYSLTKADPFQDIAKLVGTEIKDPISADTLFYPDLDPPEYAIFWHLRVRANTRQFSPARNHNVRWVSPAEAVKKLTLESEKELIKSIEFPSDFYDSASGNITLRYDYKAPVKQYLDSDALALERLEGDLRAHSAVLEYRIRENSLEDGSIPAWGEQAGALVTMAYEQMKRGKIDPAWKSLHASVRLSIFGMEQNQLNDLAKRFRQEATNLNEWRQKAVYRLLGEFEQPGQNLSASSLYLAAEIRDEHFSNNYYKNRLTKSVINTLLVLLTVTIVFIFVYIAYITQLFPVALISSPGGDRLIQTLPTLTGVMLFGLFGGVMSSLFRVKKTSDNLKNPELISSHFFTTIRVFTGGAAAIAFFFFLESEFFNLVLPVLDLQPASGTTYFVISFVCGFSERLLIRAVASVADKE